MNKAILTGLLIVAAAMLSVAQTFEIDIEASSIEWTGSKVIGGGHNGSVNLQSSTLTRANGKVAAGNFTIDMTSVEVLDLSGMKKGMLEGHLSSKDFFHTKKHETATLTIKSIDGKKITADLSIKGITHPVEFNHELNQNADGTLTATANIEVDRTKYDIKFRSNSYFDNLKDKAISDTIEFKVKLVVKNKS